MVLVVDHGSSIYKLDKMGKKQKIYNFSIFWQETTLTKVAFVGKVRGAFTTLGVASDDYAGHSFWIGAATAASMAGLEDSVIQSLGRWNSADFCRYIRTPREQLIGYSRALAGGAPPPLMPQ